MTVKIFIISLLVLAILALIFLIIGSCKMASASDRMQEKLFSKRDSTENKT